MRAAVGPCIAQASYEVGPELLARFADEDPACAALFEPVAGPTGRISTSRATYCGGWRAPASGGARSWATTPMPTRRASSASGVPAAGRRRFGVMLSAIVLVEWAPTLGQQIGGAVAAEPSHLMGPITGGAS